MWQWSVTTSTCIIISKEINLSQASIEHIILYMSCTSVLTQPSKYEQLNGEPI